MITMPALGRLISAILALTLVLVLALSSPGWARSVTLQAAAPLPDRSDASVARALAEAVDACVRRAAALGLSWIQLHGAILVGDRVIVQMIATDDESEDGEPERESATPSRPEAPSPPRSL
jgi:hypothetical protein